MGTGKERRPDRDSRSVIQGALRRKRWWTALQLASQTGFSEASVAQAEKGGNSAPSRDRLRASAAAMGYPPELPELLVDLLDRGGTLPEAPEHPLQPSLEEVLAQQGRALAEGRQHFLAQCEALAQEWYASRVAEHRAAARKLEEEVLALPAEARREGIEARAGAHPEVLWALVEGFCEASVKAATSDVRRAEHLAGLALHTSRSEHVPSVWRKHLTAYAWAFTANARRVASDLPGAEEAFRTAWEQWPSGTNVGLPLGEWRLLDLEVSLRRDQQLWEQMVLLSKRALATAPREAKGRILLNQAAGYAQMQLPDLALKTLRRARPLVMGVGDLRLECVLLFNLANTLEQLGDLQEAERLLPEVRKRLLSLQNDLDLLRVLWLQGRIDGALGRKEKAAAALEQVGREFASREIAFDTALAGLEEGVLRLELGEVGRAHRLALALHWIFRAQQVGPAVLAALRLYCEAAEQGRLTLELAQQALAELRLAGRTGEPTASE